MAHITQAVDQVINLPRGPLVGNDAVNLSFLRTTSAAIIDQAVPVGTIAYFPTSYGNSTPTAPTGWLKCNGALLLQSSYPNLFNALKNNSGNTPWIQSGDNSTYNFRLPDLRGVFIRGYNDGLTNVAGSNPNHDNVNIPNVSPHDTGRAFGSYQDNSLGTHTHDFRDVWTIQGDASNNGTKYYNTPNNGVGAQSYAGYNYTGNYIINANLNGTVPNYSGSPKVGVFDVNGEQYLWNVDAENPLARPASVDIAGDGGTADGMIWTINNRTAATGTTDTRPDNVALLACIKY